MTYKPPFARRLARTGSNKPAPRTTKAAKTPNQEKLDAYGATPKVITNVSDALEAVGAADVVVTEDVVIETTTEEANTTEEWSMKNKKAELLDAAGQMGLTVDGSMTKAAILSVINEAVTTV